MPTKRTQGRKYPRRKLWDERQAEAFKRAGEKCEISGAPLSNQIIDSDLQVVTVFRRAADHLFPERFVRRFCIGADPHVRENIFVITPGLHAKKTAVECHIYKGDFLRYKQELLRLGWDSEQIMGALQAIVRSVPRIGLER